MSASVRCIGCADLFPTAHGFIAHVCQPRPPSRLLRARRWLARLIHP